MGRAFEYRKATKMKRWAGMAKAFTRVGRQIALAIKSGGGDPNYNPRLRMAIQNAKAANMPKANVDNAIKKATSKDSENYEEVIYEGYAPHGIAVLVETATDNPTRTVANVRHVFSKYGGSLGTFGSVSYMFSHKAIFAVNKTDIADRDEFELEMIDAGLEEIREEDEQLLLISDFSDFGTLNKALDDKGIEFQESTFEWVPSIQKKLTDEEVEEVIKLIEKMEEDDDVQNVFHTMDMSE
ncbi:MAG: YebC/PmpR family DNA-binding transcriptional regulator [Saprospiraceae bacterium]|nr:YebC/PmpR family DNA-binding transcriptional regulator [Saprospiraceae bacterium]MCF8252561.1 YebC/PmpR family DNA-binding transcriptional regulator [Saprospiraceae bacterium]MCF8282602.1 YebC/PmpR family DNA-binding transcriptional regulator [Bacteroidales bacterium]MCF8314151.1 YebC/PmpR family DNA-binding transcriptional regulator [Saprospiraceae bacterium]MCF8442913.1 YebC/PmpR family DNA-binding transcriptional regulator [Saprospiraceae bacterium]